MKVCRSNYLEIVKIVPFSERRSCFCHFLRSNGIAIEKINYKNHISKKELRKAYKIVGGKIKCRKRKIKCRIFATNYLSFNLKLKL